MRSGVRSSTRWIQGGGGGGGGGSGTGCGGGRNDHDDDGQQHLPTAASVCRGRRNGEFATGRGAGHHHHRRSRRRRPPPRQSAVASRPACSLVTFDRSPLSDMPRPPRATRTRLSSSDRDDETRDAPTRLTFSRPQSRPPIRACRRSIRDHTTRPPVDQVPKLRYCLSVIRIAENTLASLRRELNTLCVNSCVPQQSSAATVVETPIEPDSVTKVSCTCSDCQQRRRGDVSNNSATASVAEDAPPATTTQGDDDDDEDDHNLQSLFALPQPNNRPSAAMSRAYLEPGYATSHYDCSACAICFERTRNLLILPCRHLYTCDRCFDRQRSDRCSICYAKIDSTTPVFLA